MGALSWGDVFFDIEANRMAAKLYGEAVARIVDGPRDRGGADAEPSLRVQAADHRPGLLRDVQPRQRHAGRPAQGSDRRDHADGDPHRAGTSRPRRDHLRHRLRRDDRRAHPNRHPWPRRDVAGRLLGVGRPVHAISGIAVAGFPNLFIVQAPGSPSAATNFVAALEQHVEWIGDCIAYLRANGYRTIEALPDAQREWIEHTTALVAPTVLVHPSCNSWYNGGNVPGKKRMYMGYTAGIPEYRRRCDEIADAGLHRLQARMRASERARLIGRDFAGVLPRAHAAVASSDDWKPLSQRGARQLGEVVLDELALSGMTLTAPPPKLERTVDACAAAADGVVRAQRGSRQCRAGSRCGSGPFGDAGSGG